MGCCCCWAQAAKTYLERNFESFGGQSVDDLIKHALHALTASQQVTLGGPCYCFWGYLGSLILGSTYTTCLLAG